MAHTKNEGLEVQHAGVIDIPSPLFSGEQMTQALVAYKALQSSLDKAMPDQLMKIGEKGFRKKGYWRAVAVAFNLSVDPVTQIRDERTVIGSFQDGSENYLYAVTYRASAPNGRYADGDGACAASEKQSGRMEATEHNVRSHAHTRAYNRAVSNLVGFGEVSAEELTDADRGEGKTASTSSASSSGSATAAVKPDEPVRIIQVRPAEKDGKPSWIKTEDGREGSTFDKKLVELAKGFSTKDGTGEPVVVRFKTTEKNGRTFMNVDAIEKPGPVVQTEAPAVGETDTEPVGQPEKVLTVAEKQNDKSKKKYWNVGTDKRAYVTVDQAMAQYADSFRQAAKEYKADNPECPKVIVVFKVTKANGKAFNEITEITVAPLAGDADRAAETPKQEEEAAAFS